MREPTSFTGKPVEDGPRNRRIAALVVVLIVGFIAIAVVKPWGSPVAPASPTSLPSSDIAARVSAPGNPTGTPVPTESSASHPTPLIELGLDAFLTPVPPPATATWTGINWQRLDPADPLSLVRSVVRWRGGFIAIGSDASGGMTTTPVWTSRGGTYWDPLPFNTGRTFWPGLDIVGVFEVSAGLVAITELGDPRYCLGGPGCLPFMSWTSPDGRTWTPEGFFTLGEIRPMGVTPLVAFGPAGLVAVSSGAPAHVAISPDGIHWTAMPDDTIPKDFAVAALVGTATGYVLGGAMITSATHRDAATLWSADGRVWTRTQSLPLAAGSATGTAVSSLVELFVVGRKGLIAEGWEFTSPGAALWLESSDGLSWRVLDAYPPLGPITFPCPDECGVYPEGALVGDGERLIALQGGPDARAWTSSDGLNWRTLEVTGDLPDEQATQATILPGGVLLSDGPTTWFGEAVVK